MQRYRRALFAALISGLLLSAEARAAGGPTFELRGLVRYSLSLSPDNGGPIVQISSVEGELQLSSLADLQGRFRFKKLPAGMYHLTAFIPRIARARRTIEVGPSFADRKGRVEVSIPLSSGPRRPDRYQISAEQLSIPKRAREDYEKGIQCLQKRDRPGAAEAFSKAIAAAPEFAAAHYQLGILAGQQGRQEESAAHFRTALTQMPASYLYLLNLGRALLVLRDGAQAVSVNEGAVRARPDDAQAQVQLAFSYLLVDRLEEAEIHFKKTVALDPAHFLYPQLALAEIYNRRQDYESVVRQLEEFLKLHPDSAQASQVALTLDEARRQSVKLFHPAPPR